MSDDNDDDDDYDDDNNNNNKILMNIQFAILLFTDKIFHFP